MIHQSSYQARRIVGQLQNNEEIINQLTKLCEEHSVRAGEVRVSGALKSVELARFDAQEKEYVKAHHGGPVEIITLHGNVATIGDQVVLRLDALVSSEQGFGVQLASGQLRRGVVSACEFVLDCFDDLAMTRGRDPQSGRMILSSIESTAPAQTPAAATGAPAPPAQPSLSWGDVSAASADPSALRAPAKQEPPARKQEPAPPVQTSLIEESEEEEEEEVTTPARREPAQAAVDHSILGADDSDFEDDDDDLPEMKPGDILDHPKLGRCRIMKVEEDDYAHIRLPRGKISKLILHIFDIQYKGQEEGRNVFSLRMRK